MFNIGLGFVSAVALSILAPDKFAMVSKFLRGLVPKLIAKFNSKAAPTE